MEICKIKQIPARGESLHFDPTKAGTQHPQWIQIHHSPFDKIFTFISVYSIIPVKVPVNDDPQSLISPRGCILNLCRWNGLSIFLQFTGWSEEYFKTLQNLPTVEFKLFWSLLLRLSPASPAQACCNWTPSSVCPGWRRSRLQSQWSRG